MAFTVLANAIQVTLTGGGLIATSTGTTASALSSDIALFGQTNQLYFEYKLNNAPNSSDFHGLGGPGFVFASTNYAGVLVGSAGTIWVNGASTGITVGAALTTNDVLCCAVDTMAQLVWFRKNGGNWNNSGTANPVTGAGGIALPSTLVGLAPMVRFSVASGQVTGNFGASAFSFTAPSGFVGWPVFVADNRVSTVYNEAVTSGSPDNRVSAVYNETVSSGQPDNRISAVYLEVVTSAGPITPPVGQTPHLNFRPNAAPRWLRKGPDPFSPNPPITYTPPVYTLGQTTPPIFKPTDVVKIRRGREAFPVLTAHVSTVFAEAFTFGTPTAQVSTVFAEAFTFGTPTAQVSTVFAEIFSYVPPYLPQGRTSPSIFRPNDVIKVRGRRENYIPTPFIPPYVPPNPPSPPLPKDKGKGKGKGNVKARQWWWQGGASEFSLPPPLEPTRNIAAIISTGNTILVSLAEVAVALDIISAPSNYLASITETGRAADTISAGRSSTASLVEAASATDQLAAIANYKASLLEAANALDAISAKSQFLAALAEHTLALDKLTAGSSSTLSLIEAAQAADVTAAVANFRATLREAANAGDLLRESASFEVSLVEAAGAKDTISAMRSFLLSLLETATAADTLGVKTSYLVDIAETARAVDIASAIRSVDLSILETAQAVDAIAAVASYNLSITEIATGVSDIVARIYVNIRPPILATTSDVSIITAAISDVLVTSATVTDTTIIGGTVGDE